MADNNAIVRDVVQTQQALTTTPDYQSPNGFESILGGIGESFGKVLSAGARDSKGKSGGGEEYNADLYDLYKEASQRLASSNMGEEEFILFDKNIQKKALELSKGDFTNMDKAMKLAQYTPYTDNLQKLQTRNAASQYAQLDLINSAGTAAVGVDAPADIKEIAGNNYLNRIASSDAFIKSLSSISPSQQSKMINGSNTPGLVDTYTIIKKGFSETMTNNQGVNPGVLYNNFYNSTVSNLVNGGMDFAVASKLVDRALTIEKSAIFGEGDEATKAGSAYGRLSLAKDYMSNQNDLERSLADSRLLAQTFSFKIRVPGQKDLQTVTMTGADWAAREKNFPNTLRTISDSQYLELVPQLFNDGPQTFRSSDLNFFISKDAGNAMNVNGSDESGKVNNNVVTGQNQFLDAVIKEKEGMSTEDLKGKGFADIRKLNDMYSVVNKDATKYMNQQGVLGLKDRSFSSIAKGVNAETDKEGFWQVDSNGQLHYYRGTMWMGKQILLDATDSDRFMGIGSEGSSNIRRYAPEITKWLNTLEDVYGLDKERLYEDFNRTQIRDSVGAQSFRVNQISPSAAYYERQAMEMSNEDINNVLKAVEESQLDVEGVGVGIAGRAIKDVGKGIVEAAETAGELPGKILTAIPDALGITKAAEFATDVGLSIFGDQQGRSKAREAAAQKAIERRQRAEEGVRDIRDTTSEDWLVEPVSGSYEAPAQVAPFIKAEERLVDTWSPDDFVETPTINIDEREVVELSNGNWGTENGITIKDGDSYVLIPTIINGEIVSKDKAIEHYKKTNEHLGKFRSFKESKEYNKWLQKRQEQYYAEDAKAVRALNAHNRLARELPAP